MFTSHRRLVAGLIAGTAVAAALAAVPAAPVAQTRTAGLGCDALASMALPHAKITTAERVEAGAFIPPGAQQQNAAFKQLPAFCRVAATLTPTPDSNIQMELWLPAE